MVVLGSAQRAYAVCHGSRQRLGRLWMSAPTDSSSGIGDSGPVTDWLLDSDPSIRWQVMRDLLDAPVSEWTAERGRVETDGWGARLLSSRQLRFSRMAGRRPALDGDGILIDTTPRVRARSVFWAGQTSSRVDRRQLTMGPRR